MYPLLHRTILFFISLLLINYKLGMSDECEKSDNIKIGLIDNKYINYMDYLNYTLDSYALNNSVKFEVSYTEGKDNTFDIIFGDYKDLINLDLKEIKYPKKLSEFYEQNDINLYNNLIPLDLDTFVILSSSKNNIDNLEYFSEFRDQNKYTLGANLLNNRNFIDLISYSLHEQNINLESVSFESNLRLFQNVFKNINKDILRSNYQEKFNSFENNENIFTLFNDGILLYKNTDYNYFQLFPKSKYIWNKNLGKFDNNVETIPSSIFGFSAYVNNLNNTGFLCYLINEEIRALSFRNFNIQLSPLSVNEIKLFENVPSEYIEILKVKNKNIINIDYKNYEDLNKYIFDQNEFINLLKTDYLNE